SRRGGAFQAVDIILSSERIIFVGAGTSGSLAKYGARFFSNIGKFSNHIDDPYFPVTNDMAKNALAIVLSVSGVSESRDWREFTRISEVRLADTIA
ncbi:SIS domain-containing protein, partial [Enterobacter hormaechei]